MRILITGAAGFIGTALARRLQAQIASGSSRSDTITLLDTHFTPSCQTSDRVRYLAGNLADVHVMSTIWGEGFDVIFHLASIPGGAAEQNYELSRDVNIRGTMALLEAAKAQLERGGVNCKVVFASTIAVFGSPLPALVDDDSRVNPQMTYASQKLIGETLVADFSRRGWLDGRSLRLAGVLARPPAKTGQLSAFMSDMIRDLAAGRSFVCPMSAGATTWAASVHNVVDNLLHAASLNDSALAGLRTITLPALRFSMERLVDAIACVYGSAVRARVSYEPNPLLETLFGQFPPLTTTFATRLGFRHDADLPTLVRQAFADDV